MKSLAPFALLLLSFPVGARAEDPPKPPDRAALVAAAREIIGSQTYCALVTIDETGRPSVRTMNPFPPEEDMTVWMATNTRSRKIAQIRKDPRVTLYYANHENAIGYVAITGHAELTEDMAEIKKRKREYWDQAFPGLQNLVLIRVVPERLDVLNYKAGASASPETWRTPTVEFPAPAR
jgi:general stress protein 26